MKKVMLFAILVGFLSGCSLETPDGREVCPNMIGVMMSDSIVPVDELDRSVDEYFYAIEDKRCPVSNMKCSDDICVTSCTSKNSKQNIKWTDGRCEEFTCLDDYWQKTGEECKEKEEVECKFNDVFYSNDDNGKCIITSCVDGKEEKDLSCEFSCKVNGCGECINDEHKCESDTVYICTNGAWREESHCALGCFGDHCSVCTEDEMQCNNSVLEKCVSQTWSKVEECQFGCVNKACNECKDGDQKCDSDKQWTCKNGKWTIAKECSAGCENDKSCAAPIVPEQLGLPCSKETFQEICRDGVYYTCQNDMTVALNCNGRLECAEFSSGQMCVFTQAESSEYCDSEGEIVRREPPCDNGMYTFFVCQSDVNGVLHMVENAVESLCFVQNGRDYVYSCDSSNQVAMEPCLSCDPNDTGNVCKKGTANNSKLGDPCENAGYKTCDGDRLIECNGLKYVAVHLSSLNNPLTCSEISNGDMSCQTLSNLNYAACAKSCEEKQVGNPVGYKLSCDNNKMDILVCDKADSGQYMAFTGYHTDSFCSNDEELLTCAPDGSLNKEQCSTECRLKMTGADFSSFVGYCQ